ncbi:hypothetical protein BDF19DRAFT_439835, partial [Syncephalis fuscata]
MKAAYSFSLQLIGLVTFAMLIVSAEANPLNAQNWSPNRDFAQEALAAYQKGESNKPFSTLLSQYMIIIIIRLFPHLNVKNTANLLLLLHCFKYRILHMITFITKIYTNSF